MAKPNPIGHRSTKREPVDLAICPHCGRIFAPTPGGVCPHCGYPLNAVLERRSDPARPVDLADPKLGRRT